MTPPPALTAGARRPEELLAEVQRALAREHRATYRLQLGAELDFDAAAALAPYLDALGASDAYLSPSFRAGPKSSHGYDVVEHGALSPELGGPTGFDRLAAALAARGLGVLLDVVPNHMGIAGDANPWWLDILENGPSSSYASYFDVDWAPPKAELRNKVLLPVLPDQYGRVLESQQLVLELVEGALFVRYAGARLPLDPRSYAQVLSHRIDALAERLPEPHPHMLELRSILTALDHLPAQTETDPARVAERLREKEIVKRRLAVLLKESAEVAEHLEETVRGFNGTPGDPRSFDLLDALLSAQAFRLADWRVAGDEVNYRRFFDVNHLAAIRMESRSVFEATHALVLQLIGAGKVSGLRVDHPDGLHAPGEYFQRLQEGALLHVARRLDPELSDAAADALLAHYRAVAEARPDSALARPLWVLAEKILVGDERLPDWWLVDGTTGYEFLGSVNGLFVDRASARAMTAMHKRFVGAGPSMADLVYDSKRLVMLTTMAGEISELGHQLDRLSETSRYARDFTLASLTRALREVIACFPVYRTYVGDHGAEASARDVAYVERAIAGARRRNPQINASVFDFVRDALLVRLPAASASEAPRLLQFAMRVQQLTGPVTAKGVEDTALYRHTRLVSLNEVGADPARFGETPAAFHDKNAERGRRWAGSLLATATHDTKRGEDVRARIDVLSEAPSEWQHSVRRWRRIARRLKQTVDGEPAPDACDEYLLYQTLVGAWPVDEAELAGGDFAARIAAYMEKATKEAKRHTGWVNPNQAYDAATRAFVEGLLAPGSAFVEAVRPFQAAVAVHGMLNSLAQTLLKIAAPGVVDVYQGTELWDLSLVDPDNRRPVDFAHRRELLAAVRERLDAPGADRPTLGREWLAAWPDGRIKMFVLAEGLAARRAHPALFSAGEYHPIEPSGRRAEHLIAFARRLGDAAAVAMVPRLTARLMGFGGPPPLGADAWGETWVPLPDALSAGTYRDAFTGARIRTETREGRPGFPARTALADFPVALLVRESSVDLGAEPEARRRSGQCSGTVHETEATR